MNVAVIVKVEYKLLSSYADFSDINIIPYSGSLSESVESVSAGDLHQVTLSFKKEKVSSLHNLIFQRLRNRPAIFRVTDANNIITIIGSEQFRARLTYTKTIAGSADGFNGYQCSVVCFSPHGSVHID